MRLPCHEYKNTLTFVQRSYLAIFESGITTIISRYYLEFVYSSGVTLVDWTSP